jgi:hypothetical protein
MGEIQDMMEAEVLAPSSAPACKKCGTLLRDRVDDAGQRVSAGWKVLMECPACGEIEIVDDHVRHHRRYRLVSILMGVSTALAVISEICVQLFRAGAFGRSPPMFWFVTCVLVGGMGLAASFGCEALALALSRNNKAKVRINSAALAVFWLVVLIGMGIMAHVVVRQFAGVKLGP